MREAGQIHPQLDERRGDMNRPARFTQAEIERAMRAAKKLDVRARLMPDGSIEIDPAPRAEDIHKPSTGRPGPVAPPKGFVL